MFSKKNIVKFFIIFLALFVLGQCVWAQGKVSPDQFSVFLGKTGYSVQQDVGSITASIIKTFLSLLGIIFIILILYAGFNWMTARGDEQQVTKAKDTIQRAVIGVIIVMAAYVITYFVFSSVPFGTPATSGSSGPIVTGVDIWDTIKGWWGEITMSSMNGY